MAEEKMYDVVVIGVGPAGLTAGLYAARRNLKTIAIGEIVGGQMTLTNVIENYPGFEEGISGQELSEKMRKQAEKFGCEIKSEKVVGLDLKGDIKTISVKGGEKYKAKAVILATGSSHRKLNAKGEDKFINKGVSYCAICLPPGEEVVANSTLTEIKNVTPMTKVLTHKGKYQKINGFTKRYYKGPLVGIKTRFFTEPTYLTPNHLVLKSKVIRGSSINYWKNLRFTLKRWIKAEDLTRGDVLVYPIVKETKDVKFLKISDILDVKVDGHGYAHNIRETHTSVRIPNKIPINKDFLRLVGYYLAEGSITRGGVNFYFNKKEVEYIRDVKEIIKKLFKLKPVIRYRENVCHLMVFSRIVKDIFENLFGKYAHNKCIPSWIVTLPVKKQRELVKGFWRGDGCIRDKNFTFVTNSRRLTYQLRDILLRFGIIPSIQRRNKDKLNKKLSSIGGRKIVFNYDKYHIVVGGPSLEKMSRILEVNHPKINSRRGTCQHAWIRNNQLLLPVRNVDFIDYEGYVYNINVEDDTYVAKNFIVHNCDGPLFKDKDVAVIGGGDSAVTTAIYLDSICSKVYLIHRRDKLRAEEANQQKLFKETKVEVIWDSVLEEILGDDFVQKIKVKNVKTNEIKELEVNGVFIDIGNVPTTELAKQAGVEVDEKGHIITNKKQETNIPGVYAAGDATGVLAQITNSVGQGSIAATNAYFYLQKPEYLTPDYLHLKKKD